MLEADGDDGYGHDLPPRDGVTDPLAEKLRSYVAAREDELLGVLAAYVGTRGVSATGEGIDAAVAHLSALLRSVELEPELVRGARHPAVVARSRERRTGPTVLIYGHYDVQPAGAPEAWTSPPYEATVRDGRIYARGVADNKGQHLAWILALRALRELGVEVPADVAFLVDGEEEIGSPGLADVVERLRADLQPDLVLWSDGPVYDEARPGISLGVRGIVQFTLEARGAGVPLHSGNWGGVAPNAAWTLIWLLQSMCDAEGRLTIGALDPAPPPLTPAARTALENVDRPVEELERELGVRTLAPPQDRSIAERLARHSVLNVTFFSAGDAGAPSVPMIPHRAVAYGDVRLAPGHTSRDVIAALEEHVAAWGDEVTLEIRGTMEPGGTDPDTPFLRQVAAAVREATGQEPVVVPPLGGALPLYVFTDILGAPCLGIPYANRDEANHAPNENLEVRRFLDGIVIAGVTLARLGG
jgi:acetylornithine deacetylase/succinyl-diaminopimelate desuccinylase-like protein